MIETMSIVHTHPKSPGSANNRHSKKKRRVSARDTYSPPVSSTLGRDLSFIKMNRPALSHVASDDEVPSSDNATTKYSASRRTCNPLPRWLANTFMSLAQKHPLRLLLPPTIQSSVSETPSTEPENGPQEVDPETVDDLFAFNKPSVDYEANFQPLPASQLSLLTKSIMQDANVGYDDTSYARVSDNMPFSTPGPGRHSHLGSSTESTVLFSTSSSRTSSSPTIYDDSRSGLDLRLAEPHTFCNSSDSGHPMNDRVQNDYHVEPDSLALSSDLAESSLFSEIYATPGPGYYSSRPVYFDYPAEDPLGFVPKDGFGMLCDGIDFRWQPFDRTNLVALNISARAAFAYGPGESIDSALSAKHPTKGEKSGIQRQLSKCASPENVSLLVAPASPCPFRFLPLPESDHNGAASVAPEIQEPVNKLTMAPKSPSAHVPGITPQVGLPQTATPSAGVNLTGRRTTDMTLRKSPSPFEYAATVALTNIPTNMIHPVDDDDGVKAVYSQASNDSIESWGYGTKQDMRE